MELERKASLYKPDSDKCLVHSAVKVNKEKIIENNKETRLQHLFVVLFVYLRCHRPESGLALALLASCLHLME